jgi:hypothetical protein
MFIPLSQPQQSTLFIPLRPSHPPPAQPPRVRSRGLLNGKSEIIPILNSHSQIFLHPVTFTFSNVCFWINIKYNILNQTKKTALSQTLHMIIYSFFRW